MYETVTIPFTVTVTASDIPLTTPAIYTPPPPCVQSILNPIATTNCRGNCPANNPDASDTLTGPAYTSTVLVTKKTPVPTVIPDPSAPPVFKDPSTSTPHAATTPAPASQPGSAVPVTKSPSPIPVPAGNTAAPVPVKSSGSGADQTPGGSDHSSPAAGPSPSPGNGGGNSPAPAGPKAGQTTATANIGSFVNSGINGPTPGAAPKPTAANVGGVPVIVLPSSSGVVIGGQVISVPPSGSSTKVVANGNTFTLGKSGIVGPGTTIAFAAADNNPASPTPVTADGLTFKVGATQAIISGKTYAIGAGAPTSTLTSGGKTVVVGPSGVGVPGKTVAPATAPATAGPSRSVVTAGGVTITYDGTEAIVGSTTYRIGPGAPQTAITVNGKTISLGALGVGLGSSTIPPAKVTAASLSAVTVDGLSLSVDASEVVIGSSTFRIGAGAPTETTVINGKTMTIGPSGVGVGSTTIHPPTGTATAGLQNANAASAMTAPRLASSVVLIGVVLAVILGSVLL